MRRSGLPLKRPWIKSPYLVVTTDVALKSYAKAAAPTSPAMRLTSIKKAAALLMDEIQWCPVET